MLVVVLFLNVRYGSVAISFRTFLQAFFSSEQVSGIVMAILFDVRLPEALTAVLAGSGLALSGLLLQTFFRNPLTGPSILGISSGASLGVALVLLSGVGLVFQSSWFTQFAISAAGMAGAMGVLFIIIAVARKMMSNVALLIIGLMVGYLVSALVSVLLFYSNEERIQNYVFWGMGSFSDVNGVALGILACVVVVSIVFTMLRFNVLNVLLLGDNYAKNLGVNLKKERTLLILFSGLLAGVITSFCGPIAFLGMAVPHLVRSVFKTARHEVLIPGSVLIGACLALVCNLIADMPWSEQSLPINAITPLFGAPVVLAFILKQKTYKA